MYLVSLACYYKIIRKRLEKGLGGYHDQLVPALRFYPSFLTWV